MRRALLARWGGTCATDGCGRPGVVPHHAEPWWLTRRTRLEDLVPYCDGCHHDLHEGGKTIKSIGSAARKEIAEAAETKVHLFLFVKVREKWGDDPERYREMGLDFPRE